ncbi:AsmA-like C-terminal region-containing protein [Marivirga arenosa]|uniref:AsmA-like C-terminal region-containing protein n=1 Tax=Marivirga arenosa TaxID=3059076 RepID=A0AA52EX73_9BACT|nr:AsmA-like C-terminal region-containing protein [Marivirga sp. BKB1-2]WNB18320.1 AsmA-like C-terminal region-containing protein [Marivirga sp. BKB1-2]
MKYLRKFILYFTLFFILLFASGSAYLYYHQDDLIDQILTEINKSVQTPVQVSKIDINWWTDFPNISLRFQDVFIQESLPNSKKPLAQLEELALSFNALNFIKEDYSFEKIILKKGKLNIRLTKSGKRNYDILKNDTNSSKNNGVNFNLKNIDIQSVDVVYADDGLDQNYHIYAEALMASLNKVENNFKIKANGKLKTRAIQLGDLRYFENKNLKINADLNYIQGNEIVEIGPSQLFLSNNEFQLAGDYKINTSEMNLLVKGIESDFSTIISLLPEKYRNYISEYESKGNAEFEGSIKGKLTANQSPKVNFNFNVNQASLYHADYDTRFEDLSFHGNFNNGKYHNLRSSQLVLKDISGTLKGKSFTADLGVKDFENYLINLSTEGQISTPDLISFFPNREKYSELEGAIDFNISLAGYLDDFKQASTASRINNSGEIILHNLSGVYQDYPLPIKNVNGRLMFNKNDIAINHLQGDIGESDIELSGFFLNIFPYFLKENQALLIEAETISQNINLNELLSGLSNEENTIEKQEESFKFALSPKLQLDFTSHIEHLEFKRFKARNISGEIELSDQILKASDLELGSCGGEMTLIATVNAKKENEILVNTSADFNGLNVDSIFYTFENFRQDFLTDQHLKGKIDAKVKAFIMLDQKLNFQSDVFKATIDAKIENGELNNFEPMLSLSDYVREDELTNLSFGEMRNTIEIKNEVIYLPEMSIQSNVSNILIQGTHTFDQEINYRLLVPLKNYKRKDKDEAFGAIEEEKDYSSLYLKIEGTTDDFEVSWDKKRSLKSIADRIKEEGKTLKKIIKGEKLPEDENEELELNEDEYFDW